MGKILVSAAEVNGMGVDREVEDSPLFPKSSFPTMGSNPSPASASSDIVALLK